MQIKIVYLLYTKRTSIEQGLEAAGAAVAAIGLVSAA
jgi:hypothetical protein